MIKRLRLKGFRRYRDETFEFKPGINFIEGDNNAGKTSVFYAIEYALFGQVAVVRSPAALMHPGERAVGVEMIFVGRDGNEYRLQRLHALPPRAKSKVEGHFTLKMKLPTTDGEEAGERYVLSSDFQDHEEALALKLQEILGLSRRSFDVAVHVRQGEITAILQGDPKLDIVLGVTAAVVSAEELRSMALENEKEVEALPSLAVALERADREHARLADEASSQAARTQLMAAEKAALYETEGRLATEAERYAPARAAVGALGEAAARWRTARERSREATAHLEERAAKLGQDGSQGERATAIRATLAKLDEESPSLERELEGLRAALRELDQRRGDLAGRIKRRQKLPEKLPSSRKKGDAPKCEACGQVIDVERSAAELATWQGELTELDGTIAASAGAITAAEERGETLDQKRRALDEELAEIARVAAVWAELREAARLAAEKEARATEALRSAGGEARAALQTAPNIALPDGDDPEALDAARAAAHAELERIDEAQRTAAVEARVELRTRREAEARAAADAAAREQRIAEIERERPAARTGIASLEKKRTLAVKLRVLAQAFKELQLELREHASQALARDMIGLHRALSGQAGQASEEAELIGLSIDPTRYAVNVTPSDVGQEVPAHGYQGGGHKLLLGLAYKLAVARMVGPCPFLLLDEPTYGLDATRRQSLLNRVADLGLTQQMLLITHQKIGDVGGHRIVVTRSGSASTHAVTPPGSP